MSEEKKRAKSSQPTPFWDNRILATAQNITKANINFINSRLQLNEILFILERNSELLLILSKALIQTPQMNAKGVEITENTIPEYSLRDRSNSI